jgi:hypothetical protein
MCLNNLSLGATEKTQNWNVQARTFLYKLTFERITGSSSSSCRFLMRSLLQLHSCSGRIRWYVKMFTAILENWQMKWFMSIKSYCVAAYTRLKSSISSSARTASDFFIGCHKHKYRGNPSQSQLNQGVIIRRKPYRGCFLSPNSHAVELWAHTEYKHSILNIPSLLLFRHKTSIGSRVPYLRPPWAAPWDPTGASWRALCSRKTFSPAPTQVRLDPVHA